MTSNASSLTLKGFFITGTDTGVGKTLVACALLRAYAARGLRVVGMKPVAAGARDQGGLLLNGDVEQLIGASNVRASFATVNPYCFEPPVAPHIAAQKAGIDIDVDHILARWRELAQRADVVVTEGAGGFCVPLNARETFADLAVRLAVPVLLVVGMRLGCLNHALLTAQAIRALGLPLAGWVANHAFPEMLHANENVSALQARLDAPLIARIAHAQFPDSHAVARDLDLEVLQTAQFAV